MKGIVYFNQDIETSKDGVLNASILWPLFYFIFAFVLKKEPIISIWISFNIACLVCLFQFDNIKSSIVWYTGLFIVLYGMYGTFNIQILISIVLSVCISICYYYMRNTIDQEEKGTILSSVWFVLPYLIFTIIIYKMKMKQKQ